MDSGSGKYIVNNNVYSTIFSSLVAGWHMIAINFLFTVHGYTSITITSDGFGGSPSPSIPTPVFATDDIIQIGGPGGFLGQVARFEIYSPGSQIMTQCNIFNFSSS